MPKRTKISLACKSTILNFSNVPKHSIQVPKHSIQVPKHSIQAPKRRPSVSKSPNLNVAENNRCKNWGANFSVREKYRRITWEVCVFYIIKIFSLFYIYLQVLSEFTFCSYICCQTFHTTVCKFPSWWDNTNCHGIVRAPPFYLLHIWNTSKVPCIVCTFWELVPQALLIFSFCNSLCCQELHYFVLVVVAAKEMALASSQESEALLV